jgi:transcription termination factor Rho
VSTRTSEGSTHVTENGTETPAPTRRRGNGLAGMLLPQLKELAGQLGIKGAGSMKKAQLLEAIKEHQTAPQERAPRPEPATEQAPAQEQPAQEKPQRRQRRTAAQPATEQTSEAPAAPAASEQPQLDLQQDKTPEARTQTESRQERRERLQRERQERQQDSGDGDSERRDQADRPERQERRQQDRPQQDRQQRDQDRQQQRDQDRQQQRDQDRQQQRDQQRERSQQDRDQQRDQQREQDRQQQREQDRQAQRERNQQDRNQQDRNQQDRAQQDRNQDRDQGGQVDDGDDDGEGGRRNRRRRGRDRDRTRVGGQRNEPDTTVLEDDVLVPAAGILDVLDNYAFVRTSGYLPGADDVYLSLSMVRKFALRRGDAVVGQVRQPREGERKEKFNPMVRIDSVNGAEPEVAKHREDITVAKPVHPSERLRLETGPDDVVGRVLDLVAPLGKGQRGLIVSPAGAGKTSLLRSIAASITHNAPECHLMVVLVDERPEEVTDFEREIKGEVIASTFDRAPADHTTVAELAVERAKRLVELGHDVVMLVDGMTRLARAFNLAAPSTGRSLPGGFEPAALYPAKRFLGAARRLEEGGSLTILATVQVESGSVTDELVLEELAGTDNWQVRLSGELAELRLDPPVDVAHCGTRREELLLGAEELAILTPLRRALAERPAAEALGELLSRVQSSSTNIELLTRLQRSPL